LVNVKGHYYFHDMGGNLVWHVKLRREEANIMSLVDGMIVHFNLRIHVLIILVVIIDMIYSMLSMHLNDLHTL